MVASAENDLVERVRRVLVGEPGIAAAYLFGSVARGTGRPGSDLDIAVLFSVPVERRLGNAVDRLRARLEDACRRPCDVLDVRRAPPDLVHRILRDGVLLAEGDRSARIAFEVAKRNEYFDLLPHLRRYRRFTPK